MKRNWMQIAILCLCLILLAAVIAQGMRLNEYKRSLEGSISQLEVELERKLNSFSYEILSELEQANSTVAGYRLEPEGLDAESHMLLVNVIAELKEWKEDTAVTLLADVGGKNTSAAMEAGENGSFTARIPLPIENDTEVLLNVLISGGGLTKQEQLAAVGEISMLLPLKSSGAGWTGPNYRNGAIESSFSISVESLHGEQGIFEPEFTVYRNDEKVQTIPAEKDPYDSYMDGTVISYTSGSPEETWSLQCDPGDKIEIRFCCMDEYGLYYDFPVYKCIAGEEAVYQEWEELRLSWPGRE